MEADKSDDVAGLSMSLDDIIQNREGERRSGRGRRNRGRGRGREGRGSGRQQQQQGKKRNDSKGPPLQLSFVWGSEGDEETFSATYNSQKLVEIKSNGDVTLNSGGSRDFEVLAAMNYVCQQIRLKIVSTNENEWSVHQVDGRWQQAFVDDLKCNAFPRRAWHSIKATLEAVPSTFQPNTSNAYAGEQGGHRPDEHQFARKRKQQTPLPPMPLLPFPPPFPFMPLPHDMPSAPQQHQHSHGNSQSGRGGRGRLGGRRGRGGRSDRGEISKRARSYRQY